MLTILQFVQALKEAENDFDRLSLQLAYMIADEVRAHAIRNVDKTFGKGQFSGAGASVAAYKKGASGALRNSIILEMVGRYPGVTAGGPGVPYAAIHEYGGTIVPKNVQWLTIPARPAYVGHRAKEFNLHFVARGPRFAELLTDDTDAVAYYLVKKVTIPPRPYMQPAIEEVTNEANMAKTIAEVFKTSSLPYEVTTL